MCADALTEHEQVHVWSQQQQAHSKIEGEWMQRHEQQCSALTSLWCDGPVLVDWAFLRGQSATCNDAAINLGHWQWHYALTDRVRPAISMAQADVHHIYFLQISYTYSRRCAPSTRCTEVRSTTSKTTQHGATCSQLRRPRAANTRSTRSGRSASRLRINANTWSAGMGLTASGTSG